MSHFALREYKVKKDKEQRMGYSPSRDFNEKMTINRWGSQFLEATCNPELLFPANVKG